MIAKSTAKKRMSYSLCGHRLERQQSKFTLSAWLGCGEKSRRKVAALYYGRPAIRRGIAMAQESALIIGVGEGLSAALARLCVKEGMRVGLAARRIDKLQSLAVETGALTYACDASRRGDVEALFRAVDTDLGTPDLVVYNPSYRTRGPLVELDPAEVEKA